MASWALDSDTRDGCVSPPACMSITPLGPALVRGTAARTTYLKSRTAKGPFLSTVS